LNVRSEGLAVKVPELVAAFTVKVTVVEWVRLPEVPVMVKPTVMLAAVLLAVSVRALVPVALVGLKAAVTPLGKPGMDKLTLLLKPPDGVIVIVLEALEPCVTVRLLGVADRLKSGFVVVAAFTVRLTVAV
jgi:hypothetical protein